MIDNRLVGTWECEEDDCSVQIFIRKDENGCACVKVLDLLDDEELDVNNIKETPRAVSFECVVPSSGYRTKNKLVLKPDGACEHQLTIFEKWVKSEL